MLRLFLRDVSRQAWRALGHQRQHNGRRHLGANLATAPQVGVFASLRLSQQSLMRGPSSHGRKDRSAGERADTRPGGATPDFLDVLPAIVSLQDDRAAAAAPLGGIRQHKQVQTGDHKQGEREQRRVGHPERRRPLPCPRVAMTITVKAMDSQRWICRTHLLQPMGPPLKTSPNVRPTSASVA